MSNKQWFAWIPVLGERLLWPRLFSGSRQNEFIETNWSDITNAYSFEGELFGKISGQLNNPGDSYYISTEEKGCTDTVDDTVKVQSIKIIVFEPGTALDPFLVPRFAFIAQAREKNQAYRINTIAMVKSFDRNGLYSFELENISSISSLGQIGKDQPAREIHRLIRDFFHQHIHNLADKVIPPVYASNPVEASERMWEEYFGGLVGITAKHSTAAILRNLRNNYQKIPHSLRRDYCSAASEAIGGYIGKLQYGSSFCAKLLNQAYLKSTNRLQETFEVFFSSMESLITTVAATEAFETASESIGVARKAAKHAKRATRWAAVSAIVCVLTLIFITGVQVYETWKVTSHDTQEVSLPIKEASGAKPSGDAKKSEVKKPEVKIPASQPAEKPAATISSTD